MTSRPPIDKLQKIVGERNVEIQGERAFVSPENSRAVPEIVKLANREKFKILPLGSGSVLNPDTITGDNLVVVRSDKLNQIVKVVPEDLYIIVQAGFPLKDLNRYLESQNLFYPLAQTSSESTAGGSVAMNLQGRSRETSIQTRDYVLALEIIDPEGSVLRVGARTFKSVTGYDLARLFVGSWGTLGFISEVSLRLVPARKRKDYPPVALEQPIRVADKSHGDLKAALSSRIKESLDPNAIFPSFESLG